MSDVNAVMVMPAKASDEIRAAFSPPKNTLFLHRKQMEVYQSPERFKVVVAGRRWGKALALDTPIPTPDGWTTMGELTEGSVVLDETGKPCNVLAAHPVMHGRPCYSVVFSDGTKVIADEGHLWATSVDGHTAVRTTRKIARTLLDASGSPKHRVFCVKPGKSVLKADADAPGSPLKHATVDFQGLGDRKVASYPQSSILSVSDEFAQKFREAAHAQGLVTTMDKEGEGLRIEVSDPGFRTIVSVTPIPSVPVRCITVDSPNRLFLCSRSFIPTHNTQLAKVCLIKFARKRKRLIWYVAPSYRMAKQIMWPELVESIPRAWVAKYNEAVLKITLVNGSRIELKGADTPDSLRGVGIHYLVMDEFQDIDPDAWVKVLRPTLASTGGHALFIGTPKSFNSLYKLWELGQKEDAKSWNSWQFPTITSPFIPVEELEAARADMDAKSYAQEFLASFETMSGRVYYPFDRKVHVKPVEFNSELPILIGQDFNIDPMSSVIMQVQKDGTIFVLDEIVINNSNTQELCDELDRRYWRQMESIIIYPDPAGAYRGHQRGESDLDIFRERGFKKLKYRRKHPAIADRVNAVNRMLMSANGKVRMFIDPRCKNFIEALEQTIYIPGGREVDKSRGTEHAADAAGYCIEFEFPVKKLELLGVSI